MDIIVVYHGAMTVAGQSVTLNTGLVPSGAPIPQLAKVSFPHETDMYSGGKFDLGSILSAIPGRIMRGLSGLVSGLLGPEEAGESPVKSAIRREFELRLVPRGKSENCLKPRKRQSHMFSWKT
jgi:hypothetical protein